MQNLANIYFLAVPEADKQLQIVVSNKNIALPDTTITLTFKTSRTAINHITIEATVVNQKNRFWLEYKTDNADNFNVQLVADHVQISVLPTSEYQKIVLISADLLSTSQPFVALELLDVNNVVNQIEFSPRRKFISNNSSKFLQLSTGQYLITQSGKKIITNG
jgi:hypothetical protein